MNPNYQTTYDVKTKKKALISIIIVAIIIGIGIVSTIWFNNLPPVGGMFGGLGRALMFFLYMIVLYIIMGFFTCYGIYNLLNYKKKTSKQYKGVAFIIFLAMLITPYALWIGYSQYQAVTGLTWRSPTSSQLEKVSEAASILSERTGYEITFLEYEWVDIDEYKLSEINDYIDKVLNDIYWLTIFIYTDDINTFDAKKCMDELTNRLHTEQNREWYVYIYEKNVGDIRVQAVDENRILLMKESGSPQSTLRGDNYLDDKILIHIQYGYSIEYGVSVNNIFNQ